MDNASAIVEHLGQILSEKKVPARHMTVATFCKALVQLIVPCIYNLLDAPFFYINMSFLS